MGELEALNWSGGWCEKGGEIADEVEGGCCCIRFGIVIECCDDGFEGIKEAFWGDFVCIYWCL